jgi:type II secretory pathway component PulF
MFWKALEESGILNVSAVALIKAGEESGRLAENLKVVAEQIHKNNVMTSKVRSALLYPAFLLTLLVLVGSGIGLFLLPKLAEIFNGLDVQLNLLTRLLINFGSFWSKWGFMLTGLAFVMIFILVMGVSYNKTLRGWVEIVLFKLPGLSQLMYQSEISRFGFILGTLLEAGLPAVEALDSLSDSMTTKRYRDATNIMRESIEEGNTFATTFDRIKDKKAFPGPIRQLIISAEKSGNLSETLIKLSKTYEDKADITARNLETLLEPVILVLIAIGVLFVALAVVLPIYSLIGGIDAGGANK